MRSKIITCALAASILAVPALSATASARGFGHGGWGHGGGWGHHGGWGAGLAGFATGALIGGALASGPYYGGDYYGYYGDGPVVYGGAPGGDATAYCMQRYRSYDPASGTFLGYDGVRHPCP